MLAVQAQNTGSDYNRLNTTGSSGSSHNRTDSLGSDKEIPTGIKVWTVDELFGDRQEAQVDTMSHLFMNTIFTTGLHGEYNTTGNVGAPRINRIFIDRAEPDQFIFSAPYDYFNTEASQFHFTNTLSPFTNITYNTAGNRTNGEDHFKAKFGVNAGKRIGAGFSTDYIYGRGYYSSQSTSHFNFTLYGSYLGDRYQAHLLLSTNHEKVTENGGITNDNYITHPESFSDNFATSEIPTVLEENWNRNTNFRAFLTHRYSVGFNRKVKMTEEEIKAKKFALESKKEAEAAKAKEEAERKARRSGQEFDEKSYEKGQQTFSGRPDGAKIVGNEPADTAKTATSGRIAVNGLAMADSLNKVSTAAKEDTTWMKDEYVPVTSFIHTARFDTYDRIYQAYQTPENFYANDYYSYLETPTDSIYDQTKHYRLRNTFAISMLEGFNKWAKAGVKAFVTSDLRHFTLPDSIGGTTSYNEHNLSVGGQLAKTQGQTLHYNATAEVWLTGQDAGQLKIDAAADLNFRLFGDTVTLAAKAFLYHLNPTFYYRHYHSRHYWWDNDDMDKTIHSRIEGLLSYRKTSTSLRVAFDEIKNYTYMGMSYAIDESYNRTANTVAARQSSDAITLLTLSLAQNFKLGPLNWENIITYQKSTNSDVLPVPDLNIYTNLFLRFKIAHVLKCDFGADARFFTKYYAPDYAVGLGSFAVQEGENKTQVGGYPLVNVYANFHLKHTRFFVMMSHVNAGTGSKAYFFTPHYPLNQRILRFGLSWNFFN